ncbi:hypothetical protein EUA77_00625, partial [TM7 phylum sp. oral taxon 351]
MNGGNRLENLIRGGNQQPVEQESNSQVVDSPSTTSTQSQSQQVGQGTTLQPKNNMSTRIDNGILVGIAIFGLIIIAAIFVVIKMLKQKRKAKEFERALKMIPMLIHLPPSTDDIQGGGRDERDVNDEAIS